jgi:hypothetical protein
MNSEISKKFAEQEARIAALESQVAALSVAPAPVKKGKKADKPEKEARKPSAGNVAWAAKVKETVADMVANGWESWTDASGNVFAASRPATIDGRETHVFVDTGKEPNYAKGGLARASYLKTKDSPEEQAKTRARAAKRAEVVAAKATGEAPIKPKRVLTEEQKAKMQAGRKAKKDAAPAAEPAEVVAEVEAPKPKKVKIATKKPAPKVYDLSFNGWAFNGEDYITNERGDVLTLEGDWMGRFNGKIIDDSVERPTDIDAFLAMEE